MGNICSKSDLSKPENTGQDANLDMRRLRVLEPPTDLMGSSVDPILQSEGTGGATAGAQGVGVPQDLLTSELDKNLEMVRGLGRELSRQSDNISDIVAVGRKISPASDSVGTSVDQVFVAMGPFAGDPRSLRRRFYEDIATFKVQGSTGTSRRTFASSSRNLRRRREQGRSLQDRFFPLPEDQDSDTLSGPARRMKRPLDVPISAVYEVELSWEGDSDLLIHKSNCPKHPGHKEFIPVQDFKMEHLPHYYQNELVEQVVHCLSQLTVRLTVSNFSPNRPDPPYPPTPRQDSIGRYCPITGSGHVSDVYVYTERDRLVCRCQKCTNSDKPETSFGKIYIHTAAHVVHGPQEAPHTTCYLLFNDDAGVETKLMITGMENVEVDLIEDRCWMACYTHETSLVANLQCIVEQYERLQQWVRDKYYVDWFDTKDTDNKLTIIVSHPHGCDKHVSIGEFVDRHEREDDPDWTQYSYTTPTCTGSSGAPVFILGKRGWFDYHHHSGTFEGLNISTYGLF